MTDSQRTVVCFGPFRLNSEAEELWRGAERVELRGKCFDLLLFLVQNRGKLMSREALLQRVWSDVVVTESTLSRTITEIRDALHDDPGAPRYIETVPRRGYKFIAPVLPAPSSSTGNVVIVHRYKEYLLADGTHVIGRAHDAAIRLLGPLISRHHARIHVQSLDVTIEDLGSKNGTVVNGQRVTGTVTLRAGDTIDVSGEMLILSTGRDSTTAERLDMIDGDEKASR